MNAPLRLYRVAYRYGGTGCVNLVAGTDPADASRRLCQLVDGVEQVLWAGEPLPVDVEVAS